MRRFALLVLLLAAGCGYPHLGPDDAVPVAVLRPAPGPARAERVIVISIDGLRPDAIEKAGAETLKKLISKGAYCPKTETIRPSITLPSHTSMLTGLDFSRHEVVWNNYRPGHIVHPTIFSVAQQSGKQSAMLFSKDKFHFLANPKSVAWIYGPPVPNKIPEREDYGDPAMREILLKREEEWEKRAAAAGNKPTALRPGELMSTAEMLARAFREVWTLQKTPLIFVHFREPDSAGHRYGWMGPEYLEAVRQSDQALGAIVELIEKQGGFGRHAVIVSADHGGSGRGHYKILDPNKGENVTIPWICVGPKVPAGLVIDRVVRTYDTAPTALAFLGIGAPETIDGKIVEEVVK